MKRKRRNDENRSEGVGQEAVGRGGEDGLFEESKVGLGFFGIADEGVDEAAVGDEAEVGPGWANAHGEFGESSL